tara:strand:+ start:86 stop:451 length:366 start_codon:yes stop_codon:yes gene_type:complete
LLKNKKPSAKTEGRVIQDDLNYSDSSSFVPALTHGSVTPTCFQSADTLRHFSLLAFGPRVSVLVQPVATNSDAPMINITSFFILLGVIISLSLQIATRFFRHYAKRMVKISLTAKYFIKII